MSANSCRAYLSVQLMQGVLLANVPMIILTIDPCISCTER